MNSFTIKLLIAMDSINRKQALQRRKRAYLYRTGKHDAMDRLLAKMKETSLERKRIKKILKELL